MVVKLVGGSLPNYLIPDICVPIPPEPYQDLQSICAVQLPEPCGNPRGIKYRVLETSSQY